MALPQIRSAHSPHIRRSSNKRKRSPLGPTHTKMSTSTTTHEATLRLSANPTPVNTTSSDESFSMAQDYGMPPDPNRMEAANQEDWDYSQGNPPNPIRGVVDISLRPNNAVGFVFNTFIYVMFRGVSVVYVCKLQPRYVISTNTSRLPTEFGITPEKKSTPTGSDTRSPLRIHCKEINKCLELITVV